MSTHENPRRHDQVDEPDALTSELLLDGREQEHPLAGVLAAANAPSTPRELRREGEALHAFASREVLDARTAAGGLATERIFTRMRSRRDALAAAFRPVPLAKGLVAGAVALAAVLAVGATVTGQADPVDSTTPAGLALAGTATTTTGTTPAPSPTTTTTAGTATTTEPGKHARFRGPAVCAPWWGYARHHGHKTWPTTWPTTWPSAWPTAWPTDGPTDGPTRTHDDPTATTTAAPTTSPTAGTDRGAWKACFLWWKNHHHERNFRFEDRDDRGETADDRRGWSGDDRSEDRRSGGDWSEDGRSGDDRSDGEWSGGDWSGDGRSGDGDDRGGSGWGDTSGSGADEGRDDTGGSGGGSRS